MAATTTTRKTRLACGSRLHGTDYIFTNLGGAYRLFAGPFAEDFIAKFSTRDEMWAWVANNTL